MSRHKTPICLLALAALVAMATPAFAMHNGQPHDNNAGTVKVHDNETADPPMQNQPHVSCDFWVEGFNIHDDSGWLVFKDWPPTGNKSVVTPTGDDLNWTSDRVNNQGNHHFLKGPYQLQPGHYRVEVYTDEAHPGSESHFAKAKMFWVDPCEEVPPTPTPTPPTDIPFFPSVGSAALGVAGAAACAGVFLMRRK